MDFAEEGTRLRKFQDWAGRVVEDAGLGPFMLLNTVRDLSMVLVGGVGGAILEAEEMAKAKKQEGPVDQPNPELN